MISEKRIKNILKPKAYKEFNKFMEGQTYITSISVDLKPADKFIHDDDFLRFMNKQKYK